MTAPRTYLTEVMRAGWWFAFLAVLIFAAELLAYGACQALGVGWRQPASWLLGAMVALMVAGIGALVLDWHVLEPQRRLRAELDDLQAAAAGHRALEAAVAGRQEWQRRLRHDLRGALSPALLTADRLLTSEDAKVKRAAGIMVQAVERAAALLTERDEQDNA